MINSFQEHFALVNIGKGIIYQFFDRLLNQCGMALQDVTSVFDANVKRYIIHAPSPACGVANDDKETGEENAGPSGIADQNTGITEMSEKIAFYCEQLHDVFQVKKRGTLSDKEPLFHPDKNKVGKYMANFVSKLLDHNCLNGSDDWVRIGDSRESSGVDLRGFINICENKHASLTSSVNKDDKEDELSYDIKEEDDKKTNEKNRGPQSKNNLRQKQHTQNQVT